MIVIQHWPAGLDCNPDIYGPFDNEDIAMKWATEKWGIVGIWGWEELLSPDTEKAA